MILCLHQGPVGVTWFTGEDLTIFFLLLSNNDCPVSLYHVLPVFSRYLSLALSTPLCSKCVGIPDGNVEVKCAESVSICNISMIPDLISKMMVPDC